jgi:hypothetical protein
MLLELVANYYSRNYKFMPTSSDIKDLQVLRISRNAECFEIIHEFQIEGPHN